MTLVRPDASPRARSTSAPRIRAIYRDGSGKIDLNWPADRIHDTVEDRRGTVWIEIEDHAPPGSAEVERLLRQVFHFHPLAIEDALQETHVPRVDDWGEYLYLVFHS